MIVDFKKIFFKDIDFKGSHSKTCVTVLHVALL